MSFSGVKEKPQKTVKEALKEQLKTGYRNMSLINLSLAEEAVQSDNDALSLAEQNLRSVKNK